MVQLCADITDSLVVIYVLNSLIIILVVLLLF